jgi:hypothetical protein
MAYCLAVAGVLALLLARTAAATELDSVRQFDRSQEEQRAAIDAGFAELKQQEPERIRSQHGQVSRSGGELALRLASGRRTFFRNDESQCLQGVIPARTDGCVEFFFVGERIGRFYLLRARYAAGSDYRLIDEASGRTTKVADEPHFSPDGARFVVASAAEANSASGVEIWSANDGAPVLEWTHVPTQYALYYFVHWEGDKAVAIEVATYVDHALRRVPAYVLRRENDWTLRGPVEASQY